MNVDRTVSSSSRVQLPPNSKPFNTWSFSDGTPWTEFYRTTDGYLLRFPDLADFEISADGRRMTCCPVPGVPDETVQHLYLNQVLPLMLSKQGKPVFHASAVEVAQGAVAFVAESGRGKSTLAASFAVNGYRFLTDDGLVLEPQALEFDVIPSHASIRLWEDSREQLIALGTQAAPPLDYTSKARLLAGEVLAFCPQPRTLRRVYFLGDGNASTLTLQRVSASEALVEWVKHSFLLDIDEKPRLASHFDQVSRLASHPIHYRLDYPRCFESLAQVRRAIVEHAQQECDAA
jgi:hypothetical protein